MTFKGIRKSWFYSRFILLCAACIFLLNSCTSVKKDGPPSYHVDVSKIPDAIPKVEPLSKIGNKPSYQVFGKKYYVLNSSKNYQERGVASWYGTKFHQRHTSSGEPYNMLGMTAAHKSLPIPTYVEVTNLTNGKKVIVKVNDRGPFSGNRLIDLSYAAAKKLGMTNHGTARVEVRAIDPKKESVNALYLAKNNHIKAKKAPAIYLQVGAFQNKSYAEKLQKQLTPLISSPVNIQLLTKTKPLYRVQIGPIDDLNRLADINKRLKLIGIDSKELWV